MKTAGMVEDSGHCIYSIGLKCFLKLPFAVSFSVLFMYIYICTYVHICIHIYLISIRSITPQRIK